MSAVTGVVTDVRAAHRFDEAALGRWLAGRLPGAGAEVTVRQFEGGQSNPTFLLETGAGRWVLRKKPAGTLLASAHMIEREQRVMAALAGTAVPVPAVPIVCEDSSIIGTPFFVMEYVHGRIVRDPSLPGLAKSERSATHRAVIETLARIHDVDPAAQGLSDFGKPTDYVKRQTARWSRQYRESRGADAASLPAMDWLMAWLPENIPARSAVTPASLVHGDYRLDNLVLHPTGPRVLAVLDWELSTLGDPLTDLAYFCMPYHLHREERGLSGFRGHDLVELGIPSEAEVVRTYCAIRGIPSPTPEAFAFYVAFGLFRIAAIAAGIEARVRQGNAASATNAAAVAAQTVTFAETARAIAEGAKP